METKKPKSFRWALWWGLGIMLVCLVILIADAISSMGDTSGSSIDAPMMDILYSLIYNFGIWPIIIYIGIIGPILEELSFRLWGNGKSWTGFVSVVLISLWALSIGWWLSLIILVAGVAIMVIFEKEREKRLFALMLFSSVLFALIHISNYDASQGVSIFIVAILHKFGMGLLASYLVINHNILWSMGLHILNNGILAAILGVGFNMAANKVTTVETDDFRITMQPVLMESQMPDTYDSGWGNSDSVYADIESPSFVAMTIVNMANYYDSTGYYTGTDWRSHPMINIKVEMLNGSHNYAAVAHAMEKEGWIAIDTIADSLHIRATYDPLESL